jgi:hypothetical protein
MARSADRSPTSKHPGREIGRQTPSLVMVKATTNGREQLAHRAVRNNFGSLAMLVAMRRASWQRRG